MRKPSKETPGEGESDVIRFKNLEAVFIDLGKFNDTRDLGHKPKILIRKFI